MRTLPNDTMPMPAVPPGELLAGKYRVEHLLGEGGMGVVVAATHEALRQRVAIKLLRSGDFVTPNALGRFDREARAAASLRSEHVARVLDVGRLEDGRPYMVMEYLEGHDLGDLIARAPDLPVRDVVDYVLQACEAIAEAHAAGIIHRDLKPRNLFLTTAVDGRPLIKVLDFGISKVDDGLEDLSLTRTTDVIGSPNYMSPEQLRASKDVDVRTDIWALGVILYELLAKRVPFAAGTVTELVAIVLIEPTPDVRMRRPDVPEGLVYAINRCLAKRREGRFSSVGELVGALAPFGSGAVAGITERVARIAQGSPRALPPSGNGSGPYAQLAGSGSGDGPPALHADTRAIHGGTAVAWGDTPVKPGGGGSRAAKLVAAAGLLVLLAGASGAAVYTKRARAPAAASGSPPSNSDVLPPGRKDLPPLVTVVDKAQGPQATSTAQPSALPSTRIPTGDGPPRVTSPAGKGASGPGTATPAVSTPAGAKSDDLSDIGRR